MENSIGYKTTFFLPEITKQKDCMNFKNGFYILADAYLDKYDTALLITGDSDLVPPINAVHSFFKTKRVFVAFPPNRYNISVNNAAKGSMMTGRKKLKDAQFDDNVIKKDGFVLTRPLTWK